MLCWRDAVGIGAAALALGLVVMATGAFGCIRGGRGIRRKRFGLAGLVRGFGCTGFFGVGFGAAVGCGADCCCTSRQVLATIRCSSVNCCCGVQISNILTLSPFLLFSNKMEDSV
jgi:hypothetical protein